MAPMQDREVASSDGNGGRRKRNWQNGTVASLSNKTPYDMKLDICNTWSGNPATGSFPPNLQPNRSTRFTHLRGGEYGSVAGVQYSGLNAVGLECAWILAWKAPVQDDLTCSQNKVFAVCGVKSRIDTIEWADIMMGLDEAPTEADFVDPESKTSVKAVIHDKIPGTASLFATFTLDP